MINKTDRDFNLNEVIKPYLSRWYWFLLGVFLMVLLAIWYIKTTHPVSQVQTSVLIKDAKKMSSASGDFGVLESLGAFSNMGTNSIENELEVFKSKTIVEDVLKEHNFQTPLYKEQSWYDKELYGKTSPYVINIVSEKETEKPQKSKIYIENKGGRLVLTSEDWSHPITGDFNRTVNLPFANMIITANPIYEKPKKKEEGPLYFTYTEFGSAVNDYQEGLSVDLLDKDATVVGLSVKFTNADKAKVFLNSLVRQYNVYAVNDKNVESKRTKDFIDERIGVIANELGDVETQKERYKSQNNIVDLATEARINLNNKEQTRAQVLNFETQIAMHKILLNFMNGKGAGDVLPVNVGLGNEVASQGVQDYNSLVLKRNKLLENATPDNPLVKETEKQIYELRSTLREGIQKHITSLQLLRDQFESQFNVSENNISKIPAQEKLFRGIERQQQIKENLYLLLLQKREEAAITMEITAEKARVIDKAYASKKPVAPKKIYSLAFAMFAGLLIPFSLIYLRELFDDHIATRKDVEKQSAIPVIAEIPTHSGKDTGIIQTNDLTPMAEAFRILVTNLKYLIPQNVSSPVIMVTSTVKGEGKTFVSVNFAMVLASAMKKVVVIGSDIRNPQLQRYHPERKNTKGLTEYLYGEITDVQQIIHPSGYNTNCDFIYSGSIPPNPVDLLESDRYKVLLEDLKQKYDYIVLDTAPMLLVTDSQLLSKYADVTVYVLRSEVSKKDFVNFAARQVENEAISNAAFVLNDVKKANLGYSNKYGYGYQSDRKKNWWKFRK